MLPVNAQLNIMRLSRYQSYCLHKEEHRNWSVNSADKIPFLLQLNYSNGSRNWHVNSAAEIPLSHLVRLPSTFSNHSSRTIRHMTTEAKIPFYLPGCQTCACNFSAVVAFSEDLETSRALCNQKFFFLIQWLPCNANGHFC